MIYQHGREDGRVLKRSRAWGRWSRFTPKDGEGKYSWNLARPQGLLSTGLSLTDKTEKQPPVLELPAQGVLTLSIQGSRLPFVPTRDERFWDNMLKFYNELPTECVSKAKKEAKDAVLLVLAELAEQAETSQAKLDRQVARFTFLCVTAHMLQKSAAHNPHILPQWVVTLMPGR